MYITIDVTYQEIFQINIDACKGVIKSSSFLRATNSELSGAVSAYEVLHHDKAKEQAFEKVRVERFNDKPSRLGALFAFPDLATAKLANEMWWKSTRSIFEIRILEGKYFIADSKFLA